MKRLIPVLLSTLFSIFIVRHAEKVATKGTDNPPLTKAGARRAQELARVLSSVPLKAVYATEFARTQQTAAPAAKQAGVPVEQRPADKTAELAAELRAKHADDDVLVVAHSDTIGELVKALGAPDAIGELPSAEYDNLFVVDLQPKGARLHRLHYGAASAAKISPSK